MKHGLSWHKDCLANLLRGLKDRHAAAARAAAEAKQLEREVDFYEDQIAEAERRGLEAFDRERLLLKRKAPLP